jgi:hypothetical protein
MADILHEAQTSLSRRPSEKHLASFADLRQAASAQRQCSRELEEGFKPEGA